LQITDHIKQINYATIYKVIEKYTPISRGKIAKISKFAPASVTKITRQLLKDGIITETARQASTGGRPAISIVLNSLSIHVLAIKIGRKLLSISRYNLSGEQLSNMQVDIESANGEQLIERLTSEIALVINNREKFTEKISAISITMAGLINPKLGRIISSSRYSFNNFPLVDSIEQKSNI